MVDIYRVSVTTAHLGTDWWLLVGRSEGCVCFFPPPPPHFLLYAYLIGCHYPVEVWNINFQQNHDVAD
jgi:hypothetical protein